MYKINSLPIPIHLFPTNRFSSPRLYPLRHHLVHSTVGLWYRLFNPMCPDMVYETTKLPS